MEFLARTPCCGPKVSETYKGTMTAAPKLRLRASRQSACASRPSPVSSTFGDAAVRAVRVRSPSRAAM